MLVSYTTAGCVAGSSPFTVMTNIFTSAKYLNDFLEKAYLGFYIVLYNFLKFLNDMNPFAGRMFWTSCDVRHGFQIQAGSLVLFDVSQINI